MAAGCPQLLDDSFEKVEPNIDGGSGRAGAAASGAFVDLMLGGTAGLGVVGGTGALVADGGPGGPAVEAAAGGGPPVILTTGIAAGPGAGDGAAAGLLTVGTTAGGAGDGGVGHEGVGTLGTAGATGSAGTGGAVGFGSGGTGGADGASAAGGAGGDAGSPANLGGASSGGGSAGTSSGGVTSAATGGGGATAGATSNAGAAGDASGGGGAGGVEIIDCSNKVVLSQPLIVDFESYDGSTPLLAWRFRFNGDNPGESMVSGGLLEHDDFTGVYTLEFVDGATGSSYAVSGQNPMASGWGGGVKLWFHCVDASSYTGLEFMMRASTPAGTGEVRLQLDDDQEMFYEFTVPESWDRVRVPFTQFEPDPDALLTSTDGDGIVGITFSSQLIWVQSPGGWTAETGPIEITIDDVGFY